MTEKIFKITAYLFYIYIPYSIIVSLLYLFSVIPSFYVTISPGYLNGNSHLIFTLLKCFLLMGFGTCIAISWIKAGKLHQDIKGVIGGFFLVLWGLWTNIYEIFSLFYFYSNFGFLNFGFQYYVGGGPLTYVNLIFEILSISGWILITIFLFRLKFINKVFLYAGIIGLLTPILILILEISLVVILLNPVYSTLRFFLQGYLSLLFQIPLYIILGKAFLQMGQKSM